MTDNNVDQQLRRVTEAIVDITPPLPSLSRSRRRRTQGVPVRAAAWGFFGAIVLSGAALILLPRIASEPSTSSTFPVGSHVWLTSGEPITDEQLLALLGDGSSGGLLGYVPGTAIQLAWSPAYMESLQIGLFAFQQELPELGTGLRYCLTAYAAPIGNAPNEYAGAMTCVDSAADFERLISEFGFGGGGSCAGWRGNVAYVSGVPAGVDFVEFRLRDRMVLGADVDDNGYALAAWDQDIPLVAVTYEGISPENASLLDSFNMGDSKSCAEMAGSDSPGTTLVGDWPPPIPAVEVPEGATWPCPAVDPQIDQVLGAADVPDELRYLPAGDTYHVDAAWGVDYGPACRRPPALVAVSFDAAEVEDAAVTRGRWSADAVVVVWVETPDDVLGPPPDPAFGPPIVAPPNEITASVDVDGFVVRYHPATEWMTERVEMVGVIDGLPVWIQSSGMTPGDLSAVVRSMTASASTGEVRLAPIGNFAVVRSGPVVAEVIDNVVWFVDGNGFNLEVQRAPGFDPYVSALGFTESFTFTSVGDSVGVLAREGGGTGSVAWAIQPGIFAMVQGDGTFQDLIELAHQLSRAPTA